MGGEFVSFVLHNIHYCVNVKLLSVFLWISVCTRVCIFFYKTLTSSACRLWIGQG